MGKGFSKFKRKLRVGAVVRAAVFGLSLGLLAVSGLWLTAKLTAAEPDFFRYSLYGGAVAAIGLAVMLLILLPTKRRIARRVDKHLSLGEKTQTMLAFRKDNSPMVALQREDTDRILRETPKKRVKGVCTWLFVLIPVVAALTLTATALVPAKEPPAPPPVVENNFTITPWQTQALKDLIEKDGFDAVFVGTGAGLPKFMNIEGENLNGVFSANEYLTRANLMKAYLEGSADTPFWHGKKVAVLGGGNVAMDASRMALRLGAEKVYLVYRRSEAEMPARKEEVEHAKEEGVEFHMLENAKRVLSDGKGAVAGLECLKYELGEPDASGRRSPVAIEGSELVLDVDTVVVAVGNASNPLIPTTTEGLEINKRGNIVVDPETNMTSIPGVFAGGDIVLGAATVILAMGEGRKAAAGISAYLKK